MYKLPGFSVFISGRDKTDTYTQPPWYVFPGVRSHSIPLQCTNFYIYCMRLPHKVINLFGSVCIWKL